MKKATFDATADDIVRCRQVVSVVADEKLRRRLFGGSDAANPPGDGPRFDWVDSAGHVDAKLLRSSAAALQTLASQFAILNVGRIESLPVKEAERQRVGRSIAQQVAARLPRSHKLDERSLNAALSMFTMDVSTVRRDCVEMGLLRRTADGSEYEFACPEGEDPGTAVDA